jgi:hypothetical protein
VVFYGVVSSRDDKVIEFFVSREDAEAMIATVVEDDPNWAGELSVEEVDFGRFSMN